MYTVNTWHFTVIAMITSSQKNYKSWKVYCILEFFCEGIFLRCFVNVQNRKKFQWLFSDYNRDERSQKFFHQGFLAFSENFQRKIIPVYSNSDSLYILLYILLYYHIFYSSFKEILKSLNTISRNPANLLIWAKWYSWLACRWIIRARSISVSLSDY